MLIANLASGDKTDSETKLLNNCTNKAVVVKSNWLIEATMLFIMYTNGYNSAVLINSTIKPAVKFKRSAISAKAKHTSPLWKHFALEIDKKGKVKNDEEVVCWLCSKEVIAKGSNTSNLISHLHLHHPLQYIDYQKIQEEKSEKVSKTGASKGNDVSQTTIVSTMEKLKKYDRSSKKWKQLTDSVTYFLAKDMLLLYSVETEGFQRIVKTFNSQNQLPN